MTSDVAYDRDGITLMQGDCLEILPTLGSGSVDAIVTDPPYGKGFHDGGISGCIHKSGGRSGRNPAKFRGQKIAGDERPDTSAVADLARILRDGGALYLFSQWMVEAEWVEAIEAAGLTVRNRLIWVKPMHGAGDLATTFGPQHESILYATKGRHELRGRRDGDVWAEPLSGKNVFRKGQVHPNQKPLDLISWLIRKSSDPDGLILDCYAGSATTLVAAAKTGRNAIGIEIDPGHVATAIKRLTAAETPLLSLAEAAQC